MFRWSSVQCLASMSKRVIARWLVFDTVERLQYRADLHWVQENMTPGTVMQKAVMTPSEGEVAADFNISTMTMK